MWSRHLVMGVGSFALGALLLVAYLRLSPRGPHRAALTVLDVTAVVVWLAVFAPLGLKTIATRSRVPFFCFWSVTTLGVIALSAVLDGGGPSPLATMLVLPVLFAGLVYPLSAVCGLAVLAEGLYILVVVTGQPTSGAKALVAGMTVGLAGGIAVTAAINRDAQERTRRRLTERLEELATRDGLTGCLTYQAFQEALRFEAAKARRYGHPFAVVMVDIDRFKEINDVHGHAVGNDTLRALAQALLSAARSSDLVGRLGGDELAVLLPGTTRAEAHSAAQRLQERSRAAQTPVPVTASFGVSPWCGDGDDVDAVLARADQALYEAKHAGRDRLVLSG